MEVALARVRNPDTEDQQQHNGQKCSDFTHQAHSHGPSLTYPVPFSFWRKYHIVSSMVRGPQANHLRRKTRIHLREEISALRIQLGERIPSPARSHSTALWMACGWTMREGACTWNSVTRLIENGAGHPISMASEWGPGTEFPVAFQARDLASATS